jgi:hypothetical protein
MKGWSMVVTIRSICASALALLVTQPAAAQWKFEDSFDGATTWGKFEERLSVCAAPAGVGVGIVQNGIAPVSAGGGSVLEVGAGAEGTRYASHVVAQKRLLSVGPRGRWHYRTHAWVNADTIGLTQTGPELSVQSTHPVGLDAAGRPVWRTHTAALQYVGNVYDPAQGWQIWTIDDAAGSSANGDVARWAPLPAGGGVPGELDEDGWWTIDLEFDYDLNEYVSVAIGREGAPPAGPRSLAGWRIAREEKFTDAALWATLEAESLYDCDPETRLQNAVWQNTAFYDDVCLEQVAGSVPSPPTTSDQWVDVYVGDTIQWTLPELAADTDANLDPSTLRVLYPPLDNQGRLQTNRGVIEVGAAGTIMYTPLEAGGDGILYRVCDTTYYCTEAWLTVNVPNRPPSAADAVLYLEARAGEVLDEITSPIVDLDGNLAHLMIDVPTDFGLAEVEPGPRLRYAAPSSVGQTGFHVLGCDVQPWGWCAGAWVVVDVKAP